LATYWNWWFRDPTKDRKRIQWVCGSSVFLVEDLIQEYIQRHEISRHAIERLAGSDSALWPLLAQDSVLTGAAHPSLFLVRRADAVASWTPLAGFLGRMAHRPGVHVLLVSEQPHAWVLGTDGRPALDEDRKKTILPHVKQIENRTFGESITCDSSNEDRMIDWLMQRSQSRLSKWDARFLIQRVGGDPREAAQALAKCQAALPAGRTISRSVLEVLTPEHAPLDFVAHLTRLEKPEALQALTTARTDVTEARAMLGRLSRNLDALVLLAAAHGQRLTRQEAMSRPELPRWAVATLWDVAGSGYTGRDVLRRRKALMELDGTLAAWQSEELPVGALEVLTACW
jgi:hypothetical protein